MTEKTKRKNDVTRSRRPLAIGLMALLMLVSMTGLMLTSLSAQADPTGHLYYGYTIDPTVEAFYRVDLAAGGSEYQPWPLPRETTVGYEAPPPPRTITRRITWQPQSSGRQANLVITDAATGSVIRIVQPVYNNYLPLPDASYSPDGQWAVFSAYNEPWNWNDPKDRAQDLWLIDLTTGDLTRLTETPHDEHSPTFMRDGRTILYLSTVDGTQRLFKLDLEDGLTGLVTPELGRIAAYQWSPDDTLISLLVDGQQADEDDAESEPTRLRSLVLMEPNPDTWAKHIVLSDSIYAHVWSPDSQWLAYTTYDPMEALEGRSYGGIMMGMAQMPNEEQPTSLWIIRTDGTDKQLISGARMLLHSLDWLP